MNGDPWILFSYGTGKNCISGQGAAIADALKMPQNTEHSVDFSRAVPKHGPGRLSHYVTQRWGKNYSSFA